MADVIDASTGEIEGGASSFNAQEQKNRFVEGVLDTGTQIPALKAIDSLLRNERKIGGVSAGQADVEFVNSLSADKNTEQPKKTFWQKLLDNLL